MGGRVNLRRGFRNCIIFFRGLCFRFFFLLGFRCRNFEIFVMCVVFCKVIFFVIFGKIDF